MRVVKAKRRQKLGWQRREVKELERNEEKGGEPVSFLARRLGLILRWYVLRFA